ncbi:MAG: F-box protein [Gemmatimonadales bacterium]|nr:F-box protein [Gemmatimonadales bacterium]
MRHSLTFNSVLAAAADMNWEHLPSDILFIIADALPVDDSLRLSLVCTSWKKILESERFWCSQYSKATGVPREQLRFVQYIGRRNNCIAIVINQPIIFCIFSQLKCGKREGIRIG